MSKTTNREAICRLAGISKIWARTPNLERESKTYRRAKQVKAVKKLFEKAENSVAFAVESERENLKEAGLI